MSSYEYKSDKFCVVYDDGDSRNQMLYNRVSETICTVEKPDWINLDDIKPKELIEKMNSELTGSAYIGLFLRRSWPGTSNREYGEYIYFCDDADAMAFKLRWS